MVVPEVNKEALAELEAMGFPTARSTRALHFTGPRFPWSSDSVDSIEYLQSIMINTVRNTVLRAQYRRCCTGDFT